MIKKFKKQSTNIKLLILLAIVLITGIILRWDHIKRETSRSFKFFRHDNDAITINKPRQ